MFSSPSAPISKLAIVMLRVAKNPRTSIETPSKPKHVLLILTLFSSVISMQNSILSHTFSILSTHRIFPSINPEHQRALSTSMSKNTDRASSEHVLGSITNQQQPTRVLCTIQKHIASILGFWKKKLKKNKDDDFAKQLHSSKGPGRPPLPLLGWSTVIFNPFEKKSPRTNGSLT